MASILDMSASSDSEDDVDYVPPTNVAASDSSCDEGGILSGDEGLNSKKTETKKDDVKDEESGDSSTKVDEKQRAKQLWETFLSDVESPKKSNPGSASNVNNTPVIPCESEVKAPKIDTKNVPLLFIRTDLIGTTKDANHTEAEKNNSQPIPTEDKPLSLPKKRGIDSVLGKIMNKEKKLTVLDKSKIDWDTFKSDEGLDNDLEKFNKGKQGFIERKRFLERADLRSFEKEKSMRQTLRKK